MKLSPIRAGMLVLLAGLALGAAAETIATVNGKAIPSARLEALEQTVLMSGKAAQQPTKADLIGRVVTLELASQAFEKLGLSSDAQVQNRMELARQSLMLQELLRDHTTRHSISEADIQAEFEKRYGVHYRNKYKIRRITVEAEAMAKDVIVRLKNGENFKELAEKLSIDVYKNTGGDAGWHPEGSLLQELDSAVKMLKPGEMTETPVKSPVGYHVIRLDEVEPYKVGAQGKEKEKIVRQHQERLVVKFMEELRAKAVIE